MTAITDQPNRLALSGYNLNQNNRFTMTNTHQSVGQEQ